MAMNDFGESKVTIHKGELLTAIQKNRATHAADFAEADLGYRKAALAEFEKMADEARDGRPIRTVLTLPCPADHTKDYDRVIRMLEMSTATEITVTEQQFSQFVLDEWQWQANFTATKMRYASGR